MPTPAVYYNENDENAVAWLNLLMERGLIPHGVIDSRSIADVRASDLEGFTQCHFFAGIGGWPLALSLVGYRNLFCWTGSCPCQPFSNAGKKAGFDDARHLWPVWKKLIAERRPPVVFGEQVAAASDWLRLVRSDLETMDYAVGAMPVEAASAGAFHLRDRYWFVADDGRGRRGGSSERKVQFARRAEVERAGDGGIEWVVGADGKARPVKPGIRLLAHGVPNRVGALRGFGNAIDPRPAAAFIKAAMEAIYETPVMGV